MQGYAERIQTAKTLEKLANTPAVVLLGPRQCGKSTLAKHLVSSMPNLMYLDLEKPSDLAKLQDAESFLSINRSKLICLDEIQRLPDLFPVLRSLIDENDHNGQFLLLGSASLDLIEKSAESLAGRISFVELTPFLLSELTISGDDNWRSLWLRGGFPRSYFAKNNEQSYEWRLDFIQTFLERDIPQLGIRIPAKTIRNFWQMCAHLHGQIVNYSMIGSSLGVTHPTVMNYLSLLEQTFMIRILAPYKRNVGKRLVHSPKIYLRDSGILHALLSIESNDNLMGHPIYGSSWEGFVIENICALMPQWTPSFYRTSVGAEIDLIMEKGSRRIAIECKASVAPQVAKGFWTALGDLNIKEAYVIAPVKESYPLKNGVIVMNLHEFLLRIAG